MQHDTVLSDLDHTRERAQLMESENERLRAELMRQQGETERALKQVIPQLSLTHARVCV
jgi:cell shape-determining protein MreC